MNTSLFPDVNVWVAMASAVHTENMAAMAWARSVGHGAPMLFSRVTQLGLLRLLTTRAAMGDDVKTQAEAWVVFDRFLQNPNVRLVAEPPALEAIFRLKTDREEVSPKMWADDYLAAFPETGRYRPETFDQALAKRVRGAVLLGA